MHLSTVAHLLVTLAELTSYALPSAMKHELEAEARARARAESMYAEEMRKRITLEQRLDQLQAALQK